MSLKIVTGGTTGAADGTLVSSSNKITFTAIDTVVNAHMRCDDDTYSADETFTLPSDGSVQVSFDGGSTWYGSADSPRSVGVDIGDLNVAIKLRQHAATASASGSFSTDGSFVAASALGNVSGFTVTPGNSQNALSWSAVANSTRYQVDRATDSGFTTGVTLGIYIGTGTSYTDTGLTNGTTYYYRIKAIGTVRYKDSASYATGNGTPVAAVAGDTFTDSDGVLLSSHTPTGTYAAGTWALVAAVYTNSALKVYANALRAALTDASTTASLAVYKHSTSQADGALEVALKYKSSGGTAFLYTRANSDLSNRYYCTVNADTGVITLYRTVSGSSTQIGTYTDGAGNLQRDVTIKLEARSTAINVYVDGTQRISATDSNVTASGVCAIGLLANNGGSTASGYHLDDLVIYS